MSLVTKPDFNLIFASQAPSADLPPQFNNYVRGMDETRKNNGKPTIKQFNYLHQNLDLKLLWILQNGAALPYDSSIEYAENSLAVKDGELQQFVDGVWSPFKKIVDASDVKDESGLSQQEINDGVSSIEELRLINPIETGARVYLKSINSEQLKGGGTFVAISSLGQADDGGVIVASANPLLVWKRINYTDVTPEGFGAVGDGVADDTNAIRKALATGMPIFINGTYKITETITLPTGSKIVGTGRTKTSILHIPSSVNQAAFDYAGNDNIVLEGFSLIGEGKLVENGATGINGFGASNERQNTLDNVVISDFNKDGLHLGAQWHITARNCEFYRNGAGIRFTRAGMPSDLAGSGNIIQDCYFGSNTWGIYNNGGWHVALKNPIFEANTNPLFIGPSALFNIIEHPWMEGNANPPTILNAVLVIGGRGWSWEGHSISVSGRISTHITQDGIRQYIKSTAEATFDVSSFNFTSAVQASDSDQSSNSNSALKFFTGYYGSTLTTLRDNNTPTGVVQFEAARDGSGGGRSHAHLCVYTGTESGGSRTAFGKRIDIDQIGNILLGEDNSQNLGSASSRLSATYTVKVMYTSTLGDFYGLGSPEGVISASVGSTYRRTDGAAGTCFYVKETGTGSTGWVAK